MRFLSLALLGFTSISLSAATEYKTWDEVVGDVPQCFKTCLDTFYSDAGIEDKCGSPDDASVDCVCGVKGDLSDTQDDYNNLSSCLQDSCSSSELSDSLSQISDFETRFSDLATQCEKQASENSASIMVPGLNALIASGAALLVCAAL